MKKSKILCLVLALVLVVACFAGCNDDKAVNSDVTTITVWSTNSHSKAAVLELVDEYNNGEGKEAGIFIDYQVIEGDSYAKSLELALQTGQGPDLVGAGTIGLKKAVDSGYIVPLEDMPGGKEFIEKYEGSLVELKNTYNGKTYSVPGSVTVRGLIYNKDMFKEAGLVDENGEPTPPETFEEFREYAKILTDKANNKFGTILPMKWSGWIGSDMTTMMMSSYGFDGFNPVTGKWDYSGLAPIIETYMGIIKDGSAYPGAEGLDNDQARAYFAEGLIGMKIAYSFDVGVLNDQFPAKCDWGVAPLPVVDANNKYYQTMSTGSTSSINAASVETKGADKLMEALKFFSSDEMTIALYAGGYALPFDYSIVEGVELTSSKKGWKEFAELATISHVPNRQPEKDLTGYLTLNERITTQVLSGQVAPNKMLEQFNKDMDKATAKYYEVNTNESFDAYLDKDWNVKR